MVVTIIKTSINKMNVREWFVRDLLNVWKVKAMETPCSSLEPYILVAPNGARRGQDDHPKLPTTTEDIIATGIACQSAGANGLHLHVRDDAGQHSLDSGRYLETLQALTEAAPNLEVQITTEAVGIYDVHAQLNCLKEVKPGWASISIREINRAPDMADAVYGLCADQKTRVQHILYNQEDAELLNYWQTKGVVRSDQVDRLFVLGRYTPGQVSKTDDLDVFMHNHTSSSSWMVCAFGPYEHACLIHAAKLGGDIRVGFENSLTDTSGVVWADNAASVAALIERIKGESA